MNKNSKGPIVLQYVGDGAALNAIPARDLTETEAVKYAIAFLVGTGLYKLVKPKAKSKPAPKPQPEPEGKED